MTDKAQHALQHHQHCVALLRPIDIGSPQHRTAVQHPGPLLCSLLLLSGASLPKASITVNLCWPNLSLIDVVAATESDLSMRLLVQANAAKFGTWLALQS